MKTMLILLTLITSVTINNELKRKVNLIKSKTELPFELTKGIRPCNFPTGLRELKNYLSFHVYEDIGGKKKIKDDNIFCTAFQRFNINNKNIELLDIVLEIGEFQRHILITFDLNGQPIDTLEVNINGTCLHDGFTFISSKQYRLHENLELEVYQLIPTAGKIIEFLSKWEHAELQRIDTHYLIDENGKFVKKSETRYKPQTYDINVLSQKEYNIWNGTETPLDTH